MPVQIEHPTRFKYISKIILQISLLLAFWWIGSILQSLFKLRVSGAVIGLFIVLTGLLTGFFKLEWIKSGSDFILGELVLFFIPCFVGLIKYKHLFLTEGWQLVFAVILGTICVMVVTAYSVHLGFQFENKIKNNRSQSLRNIDQDGK
ncbi:MULTISPECIES: CidA/LrgA family protein [unclassified Acinetobacter]|uniref:CidA/LrgA family protein n=1 Tax=unclassified Acinetobacter TaxID=196816 RepID=UPI0015D38530|nr:MULTISPECIES: CidA/LrgA family protein [unclassified Acinetobacter]UNW07052.1 CidA/LrgA family protein [Acinetobacter variabilis]